MAIAITTGTSGSGGVKSFSTGPISNLVFPTHAVDDYIVVWAYQRATATTLTLSGVSGWNTVTTSASATYGSMGVWYKKATSTAEAVPTINGVTTANLSMSAIASVVTGADTTTFLDVAGSSTQFAAPGTPFDITATEVTTNTDNAVVCYLFGSMDDNTWAAQTGGWTTDRTVINTGGVDCGMGIFSITQASAGSAGSFVSRQSTNGGDAGVYFGFAIKAPSAATVLPGKSVTNTIQNAVMHAGRW